MKSNQFGYSALFGVVLFSIAGCGGGGGSTPDPGPQNNSPTISVEGKTAFEGTSVSITAEGQDSDGSIASYAWTQKSGAVAELSGGDSDTVNFLAPAVPEDSDIVLTVTVTDNGGAKASADVTVSVTANMLSVTLSGVVADGPIPNANINVSVGDQSFTAKADESGVYSIDLSVDDSYSDQVVNVTASGEEANSPVKLVSLLGDFAMVAATGGGDNIVTQNELFGLNVTKMTTAIAALMEDANGEQAVANSTQFAEAAKGLDSSSVLPLTTAIKLVIDFSAENSELALPDGVDDTFNLVSNLDKSKQYVRKAKANQSASYTQAQNENLMDDNLFDGATDNSIPIWDTYYQILPDSYGDGDRLVINEDGTGYHSSNLTGHEFTWELTDLGMEITYGENGWLKGVSFPFLENNGTFSQVETHLIQTGTSIRWVTQSEKVDLILSSPHTINHYPNGEFDDGETYSAKVVVNFVKEKGIINAADILQLNADYSMPTNSVFEEIIEPISADPLPHTINSLVVDFSGDLDIGGDLTMQLPSYLGDGTSTLETSVASWTINEKGHLIIPGESNLGTVNTEIVFLKANNGNTPIVNILNGDVDGSGIAFTHASTDNMLLKEALWTEENVVGIYELETGFTGDSDHLWVEIYADGSGLQVITWDIDADGVHTEDEVWEIPTRWIINSKGNLVVRRIRTRSNNAYCEASSFEPDSSEDCSALWHEREWDLFQVLENGAHYMRHMHRIFEDYDYPDESSHVLGGWPPSTFNSRWIKLAERPIASPTRKTQDNKKQNHSAFKGNTEKLIKLELDLENRM